MAKKIPGLNFTEGLAASGQVVQETMLKQAVTTDYKSIAGRDGALIELYLNRDNIEPSAENSSNQMAEINGGMREAPFVDAIAPYFQTDKDNDMYPTLDGSCRPAYKPYYGEIVDSWNLRKYLGITDGYGISWDSVRRVWWACDNTKIVCLSEDLNNQYGWWAITSSSTLQTICVVGDYLYVTDYNAATYGKVYKIAINSTAGYKLENTASGAVITPTASVTGVVTTYHLLTGIASDGTDLYVQCCTSTNLGKISLASFVSGFYASISLSGYSSSTLRGLACDGTDLFTGDGSNNLITRMKKDGTVGYNKFSAVNGTAGLTFKDGDLYTLTYNDKILSKRAIKNTRILAGQTTMVKKYTATGGIADITYIPNLLGAGVHGYLATCGTGMNVKVYNTSFVEQTSGTPQTTVVTDGSGNSISSLYGICCDETNIYVGATNSTNSFIIKFLITDLDGSFALAAGNIHKNLGAFASYVIRGIDIIPNTSNGKLLFSNDISANKLHIYDIATTTVTTAFNMPNLYTTGGSGFVRFAGNNLYYRSGSGLISIIDWSMSQYMDAYQPYVIQVFNTNTVNPLGLAVDENNDLVTTDYTNKLIYKYAAGLAVDKALTGKGQRNIKYYGNGDPTSALKSYPSMPATYTTTSCIKAIRYRRKYAASVYSSANNVLPLDGLYLLGERNLTIIDLESNTEFMTFSRPETGANMNMIDASGSSWVMRDMFIVDDKILLCSQYLWVIDFLNDTAYNVNDSGLAQCLRTIKDRNLSTTTSSYGSVYNTNLKLVYLDARSVHAKQDTLIKPEEHNGTVSAIDNGEIYIAYGTTNGDGLIKWKAGVSYTFGTSGSRKCKISDSWNYVLYQYQNSSSAYVDVYGDVRKVYASGATLTWGTQTGFVKEWTTSTTPALANGYINDIDVKTIYRNGVAYNYVVVAMGIAGTSGANACQIIDVMNNRIETVYNYTDTWAIVACAFGKDNAVYSLMHNNGGYSHLNIHQRFDYIASGVFNSSNWKTTQFNNSVYEHYLFGTLSRSVTYSFNTICMANDRCAQTIELPRQDSFIREKSVVSKPLDPTSCFLIKNDYIRTCLGGNVSKYKQRYIYSDSGDTSKYTYVNGSSNSWGSVVNNASYFGGRYKEVIGQSGGGTQPQVSWSTIDKCTELVIYVPRGPGNGKLDITITDTVLGTQALVYDMYSADGAVLQDLIPFKGLTSEIHTVTIKARSDKNASSTNYYWDFCGCVEIVEDQVNTRTSGSITYEASFDGGTTWQDISTTDQYTPAAINHTPNGTVQLKTTFDVNESEDMWVNDEAVVYNK